MGNHHFQWVNPLEMVIFNSYVSHYQRLVRICSNLVLFLASMGPSPLIAASGGSHPGYPHPQCARTTRWRSSNATCAPHAQCPSSPRRTMWISSSWPHVPGIWRCWNVVILKRCHMYDAQKYTLRIVREDRVLDRERCGKSMASRLNDLQMVGFDGGLQMFTGGI